jgi:tetratricopeptide (TPR) repeat protein
MGENAQRGLSTRNRNRRLLRLFLGLVSVFVLYRLWADALADIAPGLAPGNLLLLYKTAKEKHHGANQDLREAIFLYKKSLGLNPFNYRVWHDLALAYKEKGDAVRAASAMQRAYHLNSMNAENVWDTAVFYLNATGDAGLAAPYLRKYLELNPPFPQRAFDALQAMDVPPGYIAEKILSGDAKIISQYAEYLRYREKVDDAIQLWRNLPKGMIDEKESLGLCNLFIRYKKNDEASALWAEIEPRRSLIVNGGFERASKEACFDWIIRKGEGIEVSRDEDASNGRASLKASFKGKNLDFAVYQQVLLTPGVEYVLKADLKTENITSDRGIYIEIAGWNCSPLREASPMLTGTNPWMEVELVFRMPRDCPVASISLKRDISSGFNNRIEGTAWLDNVRLDRRSNE